MNNSSLINLLERIKQIFVDSEVFKSTHFETKEAGISYLQSIIECIHMDDNEGIDKIVYAFGDNGYLKEIAVNGNWESDYEEINNEF